MEEQVLDEWLHQLHTGSRRWGEVKGQRCVQAPHCDRSWASKIWRVWLRMEGPTAGRELRIDTKGWTFTLQTSHYGTRKFGTKECPDYRGVLIR